MARYLIKLDKWYFEWSTVVDAPITYRMTLKQLIKYIKDEYGRTGLEELPSRLKRVEKQGISFLANVSVDEFIEFNRAGKNETSITKEEIIKLYK